MVLSEKSKPFLVLILRFLTKKRLWFLNCAGSYKKMGVLNFGVYEWNSIKLLR